jgi:adenosylcobinamide-GDP ribazoletransferase
MRAFLAALRFLTILPVPGTYRLADDDWGRATAWYPAVGLVLGVILATLDWALRWLLPTNVTAVLLLLAWVILTGALHLDGFVDCCDALFAPVSQERRLEILRDIHVGAFGIVGLVLLLLTKYAVLTVLPDGSRLPALLLIPVLGRWGMMAVVLLYPYARSGPGLGQKAKNGAGRKQLATATGLTLLVTGLAWRLGLGWVVLVLVALTVVVVLVLAKWMQTKLGGLTGDTYGAICELVEVTALLALAALAYRGMLV